MIDLKAITISEGAAGMRSQIEGLANLICNSYKNFDVQIKPFFKNLPIQLIPASAKAYQNINQIKIQSKVLVISCGKKKGDYIEVSTPKGVTSYEIKSVRFK